MAAWGGRPGGGGGTIGLASPQAATKGLSFRSLGFRIWGIRFQDLALFEGSTFRSLRLRDLGFGELRFQDLRFLRRVRGLEPEGRVHSIRVFCCCTWSCQFHGGAPVAKLKALKNHGI